MTSVAGIRWTRRSLPRRCDVYEHPLGRTVIAADNVMNTNPIHFDARTEFKKPLVNRHGPFDERSVGDARVEIAPARRHRPRQDDRPEPARTYGSR